MAGIRFSFRVVSTAVNASVKPGVVRLRYANFCWTALVKQLQTFCADVCANDESFLSIDVYLRDEARAESEHYELSPIKEPKTSVLLVISTSVLAKVILASSSFGSLTTKWNLDRSQDISKACH